jgi:transposase
VRVTTVFNKLLRLQGARVLGVEFGSASIVVRVARRARLHVCPACGHRRAGAYDRHERSWRHVALGRWAVTIVATICRIDCPTHGVVTEAVPWAVPGSGFTLDLEDLVAWLAREMSKTAVTELVRISWAAVGRIITRVVGRTLDRKRLDELYVIGLDEVSYRKGHKYLSVVANHATGDPVWMAEGRSQRTVGKFFKVLGREHAKKLTAVSMDMCAPYIAEVRDKAPQATIAFDPFHVVKLANEAVHDVRRAEARERKGTPQAEVLKGSRWALLKAPENLRPWERVRLSTVAQLNARVYRAYLLKEEIRALYHCTLDAAAAHLDAWIAWARRSRLRPFLRVARTLDTHRDGVLAAIALGLSNGRMEGLNNKIAVIKGRAYGFHSAAALIAMVYLCCSCVDVKLPI